jgi:hypothetical protein
MAHFAEINGSNVVTRVVVTDSKDPNRDEGYSWLISSFGGTWVKTSFNTRSGVHVLGGEPLRKNFALVGYSYDEALDAFIPPRPFKSWILNKETATWEAPFPPPNDSLVFTWDDIVSNWKPTETLIN